MSIMCCISALCVGYTDPYNGRVTAKHQYTCTKGTQVDYFLPRDAAEKIWSFWNNEMKEKKVDIQK